MKQVLQSLRTGEVEVAEVPAPAPRAHHVMLRTRRSLISSGTERMLLEFGRAGWLDKARQQPERVRQVLERIRTDGLLSTMEAVSSRLDEPLAPGYSGVGVVESAGEGVRGFRAGDRVVGNGPHAEVASVPANLCAAVPDGVSDEAAAFTVVGAVALQGIRLAGPTLGESFCVSGLGLVGLLAVQLLRAQGCRVLGLDPDPHRVALARTFGAEAVELGDGAAVEEAALTFSRGRGVDGVVLAAATESDEPVRLAARICRERGRIVLVGVTGLELDRSLFYEKELSFQVSRSYGPGRYDPEYESKGRDYPAGFVRWTAQRNFEAFLDMLDRGAVDTGPLVSHRFPIENAPAAYDLLVGEESHLGILLEYPEGEKEKGSERTVVVDAGRRKGTGRSPRVAFVGAGQYAVRTLIPAFQSAGAELATVVTRDGSGARDAARRFGFAAASTDPEEAFADPAVDAVVVATRHDSHAELALRALRAGKHVFLEKPAAITRDGLEALEAWAGDADPDARPILMVGFNRRFSPLAVRTRELMEPAPGPHAVVMTVNAGPVPEDHWVLDPEVGGGRIAGEGCHFVDLARFLVGAPIETIQVSAAEAGGAPEPAGVSVDLGFRDGSLAGLWYLAAGHRGFSKERIEVFSGGRILVLDDFRKLTGHGWPNSNKRLWRRDKGHESCAQAFLEAVREGRPAPIPLDQILEVTRATLQAAEGARR